MGHVVSCRSFKMSQTPALEASSGMPLAQASDQSGAGVHPFQHQSLPALAVVLTDDLSSSYFHSCSPFWVSTTRVLLLQIGVLSRFMTCMVHLVAQHCWVQLS
jgi:hypothetical protein